MLTTIANIAGIVLSAAAVVISITGAVMARNARRRTTKRLDEWMNSDI